MGTTAVAAIIRGAEAWVGHVGDSRLYQLRQGATVFRTRDHTRVRRMIEAGLLSERAAKNHPEAHVLVRALGRRESAEGKPVEAEVTPQPLKLEPGDALVLCSDGLHDVHDDADIWATVSGKPAAEAAQALVDSANDRGGPDNVTVTVLVYGAERIPSAPAKLEDEPEVVPPRRSNRALVWIGATLVTAGLVHTLFGRTAPETPATSPDASVAIDASIPEPVAAPVPVVVDAGELADAGALDAGENADAGEVDAGLSDAGALDAGPVDAGATDAGAADAGARDAAVIAPRPLDAGMRDGG
jgi:hypothetical protein